MKSVIFTLLLMLSAAPALALGGQDIVIDDTDVFILDAIMDVAAANDGTLFAISHADTGRTVMNVYRSNNGGSTWRLWDQVESEFAEGRVHQASLAVTDGNPGSVLIAWIDQRLGSPGSWVRVWRAAVADDVPSWSASSPYFIFNLEVDDPRIDTIAAGGFQQRVVLAFKSGLDILYANSEDSGSTWSSPVTIFTESTSQFVYGFDVAADNAGVAHVIWNSFHFTDDIFRVQYRRAQWGGESIGDWELPRTLFDDTGFGPVQATIAADHSLGGGGVIAASGGALLADPPTYVFQSDDAGVTVVNTGVLDFVTTPAAAWGASGPVLAAGVAGASAEDTGWALVTPDGSGWNQEILVSVDTASEGWWTQPAVALDPTRDDAPLIVGRKKQLSEETYKLWFDAVWRGDAGYGVPDPAGFSATGPGDVPTMVLVGDVTGGSEQQVVIVVDEDDGGRMLKCLDPLTGSWVLSNSDLSPVSDVALANLDGESALDVFSVRESDARLDCQDGDGIPLPGFPMDLGLGDGPYFLSGGPMVSEDVDWLVIAEDNVLTVLGEDGVQPQGWPWTAPAAGGVINGRVALGDVDGDGLGEMVVPLTERTVILNHLAQVELVFGAGEAAAGSPSLADFDDDGDLEIVIPRSDGTVHVVHHDGTSAGAAWPYDTGIPGTPSQVALADLAGNDRRDLIFMDAAHSVHAVSPAGIVLLNWEMDVPLGSPVIEPMVAKVGPGERAVIVGGIDGRLRVFTPDGPQDGWPRDMGGEIHAPVAVADVDSDGKMEMVVATTEETWLLDMGVSGPFAWEVWPMSGADPRRRGSVGSGPIGGMTAVPSTLPAAMTLHGAAPNPFNPATSIRFRLTEEVPLATLRVYDVAGRLVKTLHEGALPAGDQQVMWRGHDAAGRAVASGVYLVRLEAGGQVLTRSMVLAR